jgi:purine nucleosidase
VAELHHRHPSEKLIAEVVRSSPDPVTLIALGPLTNVARAFQRDPELPTLLGELVIMGGTLSGIGNATAAAEFNIFCDPLAARIVLRSASTITLIPLDITNQVLAGYDFLDQLPAESTRAGRFLRKIVQELGLEGIHLHDAVALVSVLHPELFAREAMACDVETTGELTTGATVFDRRPPAPKWRRNVNVATTVDAAAVKDCILRCLANAARHG